MAVKKRKLKLLLEQFSNLFESGQKIARNENTKVIFKILEEIYSKRMLMEKPQEFFSSKEYEGIADVSNISLPYQASEQRKYYDIHLRKHNAVNIRTAGTKVSKLNEKNLQRLENVWAGMIFPTTPSLQGVYEFLWCLNKKLKGNVEINNKPIFIDTEEVNKIFNLISAEIGLSDEELGKYQIFKSSRAKNIADEISKKAKILNFNDELEFNINTGATFYIATTSDKKILEFEKFFEDYGIKIKPLTDLIGPFKDADELHGSIESNAIGTGEKTRNSGKLYTVREKIASIPKSDLEAGMLKLGDDPNNSFILVDDRGANFSTLIAREVLKKFSHNIPQDIYKLLFDKYDFDTVIENKTFPGAEIKHIIDAANGVEKFWQQIGMVLKDYEKEHNHIENSIVVALGPILDCYEENQRFFSSSAKVKFKIILEAKPNLPYIESEQHTASFKQENVTLAELTSHGNWTDYFKYTDIGRALKSITNNFDLDKLQRKPSGLFKGYQIGLISENPYQIDGYKTNHFNKTENMLDAKSADDFVSQNHCFVFDGNLKKEDIEKTKYAFFKLVEAKQTDPRDLKKMIFVNQPNENFKKIIDLYYSMYSSGYIKEYPPRMFTICEHQEDLIKNVSEHLKNYNAPPDYKYHYEKSPVKLDLQRESVFIACSASSDSNENAYIAAKTAFHLALSGRNIVYGSGDKKMMGGIYRGYFAAKKYSEKNNLEFKSELIASSTPNILKRESMNQTKPEKIKDENFYLAEIIEDRKEFLYRNSNSVIILPGGAGTVDEFLYCGIKSKSEKRKYDINVLNHNETYNILKHTNFDNLKLFSDTDRLLSNAYHIDLDKLKDADDFLAKELNIPTETILALKIGRNINTRKL